MTLDASRRLVRAPTIMSAEVDGETVLISIEGGKFFGLDPIGSEIWRRLEEPKRVDELCAELKEHFEGDPATIEHETRAFVDLLSERNLLADAA